MHFLGFNILANVILVPHCVWYANEIYTRFLPAQLVISNQMILVDFSASIICLCAAHIKVTYRIFIMVKKMIKTEEFAYDNGGAS